MCTALICVNAVVWIEVWFDDFVLLWNGCDEGLKRDAMFTCEFSALRVFVLNFLSVGVGVGIGWVCAVCGYGFRGRVLVD
ncbi:transmembrane protein, putative [Medicago truncatula]|uniref:Transmembrane protein, putative n=1 Tax=Medicago truncatula TaxID=3880 RepID=A0A072TDU2_MEDTR|nr:transmembrane protein, putative [Medicago truncatula]